MSPGALLNPGVGAIVFYLAAGNWSIPSPIYGEAAFSVSFLAWLLLSFPRAIHESKPRFSPGGRGLVGRFLFLLGLGTPPIGGGNGY